MESNRDKKDEAPNSEAEKWQNMEDDSVDVEPDMPEADDVEVPEPDDEYVDATEPQGAFDDVAYLDALKANLEELRELSLSNLEKAKQNNDLDGQTMSRTGLDRTRIEQGVISELDPTGEGGVLGAMDRLWQEKIAELDEMVEQGGSGLGETEDGHVEIAEQITALEMWWLDADTAKGYDERFETIDEEIDPGDLSTSEGQRKYAEALIAKNKLVAEKAMLDWKYGNLDDPDNAPDGSQARQGVMSARLAELGLKKVEDDGEGGFMSGLQRECDRLTALSEDRSLPGDVCLHYRMMADALLYIKGLVEEKMQETEVDTETSEVEEQKEGFDDKKALEELKERADRRWDAVRDVIEDAKENKNGEKMAVGRTLFDRERIRRNCLDEIDLSEEGLTESMRRLRAEKLTQFMEKMMSDSPYGFGATEEGHVEIVEQIGFLGDCDVDTAVERGYDDRFDAIDEYDPSSADISTPEGQKQFVLAALAHEGLVAEKEIVDWSQGNGEGYDEIPVEGQHIDRFNTIKLAEWVVSRVDPSGDDGLIGALKREREKLESGIDGKQIVNDKERELAARISDAIDLAIQILEGRMVEGEA